MRTFLQMYPLGSVVAGLGLVGTAAISVAIWKLRRQTRRHDLARQNWPLREQSSPDPRTEN